MIPVYVLNKVDDLKNKIISGEIVVPASKEVFVEWEAFLVEEEVPVEETKKTNWQQYIIIIVIIIVLIIIKFLFLKGKK